MPIFGKIPEKFTYEGREYTPKSFASHLGINPDDYITLTSFTHHPFYTAFVLELPDNWAHDIAYNVPLSELEDIMDHALKNGYTVAWASDVSEKGFSWRNGLAIVPELKVEELGGTERERWERLTQAEKDKEMYNFEEPGNEMNITQEIRQIAF
jgi:bleomycin hydrolase